MRSLYLFWKIAYCIAICIVYIISFICLLDNEIKYTSWSLIKIVLENRGQEAPLEINILPKLPGLCTVNCMGHYLAYKIIKGYVHYKLIKGYVS